MQGCPHEVSKSGYALERLVCLGGLDGLVSFGASRGPGVPGAP